MRQLLVGLPQRIVYDEKVRKQAVAERYLTYLQKQGINTLIIPAGNPNQEALFALCDGFVLIGGDDIDPACFGAENAGSKGIEQANDELDRDVILYAKKTGKPLLGICRGIQSINVFEGGTLIQDIGTSHKNTRHDVIAQTEITFIDWPERFPVNSYHHQVIDRIAPGYQLLVKSPDGYIEAMIHEHLPIFGVQWHPELEMDDPHNRRVFDWLINAMKKSS